MKPMTHLVILRNEPTMIGMELLTSKVLIWMASVPYLTRYSEVLVLEAWALNIPLEDLLKVNP